MGAAKDEKEKENDQSEGMKPGKRSREKRSTAQRKKAKKEVVTFYFYLMCNVKL